MWSLNNQTQFAAERTWVRDSRGAETWIVAVKGTFGIQPNGDVALSEEQEPVHRVALFRDDPSASSLIAEADLIRTKCNTDVLLEGVAYAPYRRPTPRVEVRLRVGKIDKALVVHGDRQIEGGFVGVTASPPRPFTEMSITYERAFGGTDESDPDPARHGWEDTNPVGAGFATRPEHALGKPAPNVEYPGAPYNSCRSGRPAGFGPLASHWQPRRKLAGTYDQRWEDTRMPLLPEDFNDLFFQSAPPDQQSQGFLRGGERVHLENLTPEGTLAFDLPRVTLGFSTRLGNERIDHRAALHTVFLRPATRQVVMVWHTALPCHGKDHKLYETTVVQKANLSASAEERKRYGR